jgi:hypothetical protein
VTIADCSGLEHQPVRLSNLQALTAAADKNFAPFYFTANPPARNDFIDIRDIDSAALRRKDPKVNGPNVRWPAGK